MDHDAVAMVLALSRRVEQLELAQGRLTSELASARSDGVALRLALMALLDDHARLPGSATAELESVRATARLLRVWPHVARAEASIRAQQLSWHVAPRPDGGGGGGGGGGRGGGGSGGGAPPLLASLSLSLLLRVVAWLDGWGATRLACVCTATGFPQPALPGCRALSRFHTTPPASLLVTVGQAQSPHRCVLVASPARGPAARLPRGFVPLVSFLAHSGAWPGTLRVAVGDAQAPRRSMLNHNAKTQAEWDAGASMSYAGWTHAFDFWADARPRPGAIRVAVGDASAPHRCMVNHESKPQADWDRGDTMTHAGWTHRTAFWVYPVTGAHAQRAEAAPGYASA
jgi:hypothetical protein